MELGRKNRYQDKSNVYKSVTTTVSRKQSVNDSMYESISKYDQEKYLQQILVRSTEEKLLQYLEKQFYQKNRLDEKNIQKQNLLKIRQFYKNRVFTQSDDLQIPDDEDKKQRTKKKIDEFFYGQNPVDYFERVPNENGQKVIIPKIDLSVKNERFKILAQKLFDQKQLLDEINDDLADNYLINPLEYKRQSEVKIFKSEEDRVRLSNLYLTKPQQNRRNSILETLRSENQQQALSELESPTKPRQNKTLRQKQQQYFVSNSFGRSQILDESIQSSQKSKQVKLQRGQPQEMNELMNSSIGGGDSNRLSQEDFKTRKRNISIGFPERHARRAAQQNIFQIHLDNQDQNLRNHFYGIAQKELNNQMLLTQKDFTKYLSLRYKRREVDKIITYLQPAFELDFRGYRIFIESFNQWQHNDILFFCFFILDIDSDGLLNQNDIFYWMLQSEIEMAEKDMMSILRFLDERTEGLKKNLKEYQEVRPELQEFYQDSEPKTHKLYLKKSKHYEKKMDQNIKKDTLYNRTLFHLEHDSLQRQFIQQNETYIRESVKKKASNLKTEQKSDYTHMIEILNREKNGYAINLTHFRQIFANEKPLFFYDLICYLSLYKFRWIEYPYDPSIFIGYLKTYKKKQLLNERILKKHPLEDIFPFSYKEKSPITYKMVEVVQKYKTHGDKSIQGFLENLKTQ